MNPYRVLEVQSNASVDQLKAAYHRMVMKYHPDINHDPDAAERMKEINCAYEIAVKNVGAPKVLRVEHRDRESKVHVTYEDEPYKEYVPPDPSQFKSYGAFADAYVPPSQRGPGPHPDIGRKPWRSHRGI